MYTKEINGKIYDFKFGVGFIREIDKTKIIKDENKQDSKVGLNYAIAGLMDCDFEKLIDCLLFGNKFSEGEKLTKKDLEDWLESEGVDPEEECKELLDFFERCKFTRKRMEDLKKMVDRSDALKEAQYQAQLEAAKAGTN